MKYLTIDNAMTEMHESKAYALHLSGAIVVSGDDFELNVHHHFSHTEVVMLMADLSEPVNDIETAMIENDRIRRLPWPTELDVPHWAEGTVASVRKDCQLLPRVSDRMIYARLTEIGFSKQNQSAEAFRLNALNEETLYSADGTLLDDKGNRSIFDDVDR